jgi:hypothetical protein
MNKDFLKKYRVEIERYCEENGLSAEKLFSSGYGYNDEWAVVQYLNPNRPPYNGVLDDTKPAPILMEIFLESDGSLRFEQTDITYKYLAADPGFMREAALA